MNPQKEPLGPMGNDTLEAGNRKKAPDSAEALRALAPMSDARERIDWPKTLPL